MYFFEIGQMSSGLTDQPADGHTLLQRGEDAKLLDFHFLIHMKSENIHNSTIMMEALGTDGRPDGRTSMVHVDYARLWKSFSF